MSNLPYQYQRDMEEQFERNGCDPSENNYYIEIWTEDGGDVSDGAEVSLAGQTGPTTLYDVFDIVGSMGDTGMQVSFDPMDGGIDCQVRGWTRWQYIVFWICYGRYANS